MEHLVRLVVALGFIQVLTAASIENKFEPMVAFICDRPAMHRGVNGWIPDGKTGCLNKMEDILAYCQITYPDHNITNVVEASYLVNIENWPMNTAGRTHPHRVRPFRCLVGGFQSDALLVPQHCEFDHRHDQRLCEGFSHWNLVADQACKVKDMHLESFGMLLNCKLGAFSGVEYVCCPNKVESRFHEAQDDDEPDDWDSEEEDEDEDEEDEDDDDWSDEDEDEEEEEEDDEEDDWSDEDEEDEEDEDEEDSYDSDSAYTNSQVPDENVVDYYEAYLRQQPFPSQYNNEHKKFLAAKDRMKKNQQHRTTKLLQQWQAERDHVNELRKSDPKKAEDLSEQTAKRFQSMYASYQQEDEAEKQQLLAVHQQHIQTLLNERKRDAMDKYMKALENGEVESISKYLQAYIKTEEKDRMHTVNHYEHIKYSNPHEALRIHPFIVNHLKLSEQRIDQALQLLSRYPDIEESVQPQIDNFMKRFEAIANSIRNVVLPVPEVEEETQGLDLNSLTGPDDDEEDIRIDDDSDFDMSDEIYEDEDEDDILEDEHDYEKKTHFVANAQNNAMRVEKKGVVHSTVQGSQLGSTLGIALGGVSVFVIIVVAVVMVRRNNRSHANNPMGGYVEVDPSASPEDRHLANMQMNGYENPTYKYFEVQSNPKA